MPVERHLVSPSQLCELLALDLTRFRGIESNRRDRMFALLMEPEDHMGHTSGTLPQLTKGTKKGKKR